MLLLTDTARAAYVLATEVGQAQRIADALTAQERFNDVAMTDNMAVVEAAYQHVMAVAATVAPYFGTDDAGEVQCALCVETGEQFRYLASRDEEDRRMMEAEWLRDEVGNPIPSRDPYEVYGGCSAH